MKSMAEQLEGNAVIKHSKEPLHRFLIEQAVDEVFDREEAAIEQKRLEEE